MRIASGRSSVKLRDAITDAITDTSLDNEVLPKCRLEKAARPTEWSKLSIVALVAMADYADFSRAQQPSQD